MWTAPASVLSLLRHLRLRPLRAPRVRPPLAAPSSFNGGRFHAAAVAAFAITTCLMYQGYSASQFEAHDHVMRRSGVGGVVWLNNTWAHSFALIVVGVALRLAMARGEQSMTLSESWLLSGSLVASFLFV